MSRNAELTHLFRAMKAPAAARALPNLAERARQQEWSYERFAEALLSTEVSSRESSGGRLRIGGTRRSAAQRCALKRPAMAAPARRRIWMIMAGTRP